MNSTTNGSGGDGDTETTPGAGPKTHHNLTIVYVDHELDNPNTESIDDEAGENINLPNLIVVYINHHLDDSAPSDTSQGSDGSNLFAAGGAVVQNQQDLFRLPPELRIVIWELLLPGRRLLWARAWYGRDRSSHLEDGSSKTKGRPGRWYFRVNDWLLCDVRGLFFGKEFKVPAVLCICKESRNVALQHGVFIFGQGSHETRTWWNPDLDVLGFDHSWDLNQHSWALAHLHGLEHVKHVAIDEKQAWTVCYEAGYNGSDPFDIPRELRETLAVASQFRESVDRHHYILEFFPHFKQLTILFSTIHDDSRYLSRMSKKERWWETYLIEEDANSVTFRLGCDIKTAVAELRKYRELCMTTRVQEPDFDSTTHVEGPVYSVKDDNVDVGHLDHWLGAGFGVCQIDQDEIAF